MKTFYLIFSAMLTTMPVIADAQDHSGKHAHPGAHGSPPGLSVPAPYAGQEQREIKAMSAEDIEGYLAGKGMGLAKAAELNGYPGPMHVLEHASALGLSEAQRTGTRAIMEKMRQRAIEAGKELITAERALDKRFAERSITSADLDAVLARIGRLQAQVRQAHLQAHLEQAALLTPQQIAQYNRLRGYGGHDHVGHGMPERR